MYVICLGYFFFLFSYISYFLPISVSKIIKYMHLSIHMWEYIFSVEFGSMFFFFILQKELSEVEIAHSSVCLSIFLFSLFEINLLCWSKDHSNIKLNFLINVIDPLVLSFSFSNS